MNRPPFASLALACLGLFGCGSYTPAIVVAPTPQVDTIVRPHLPQSIRITAFDPAHDSMCSQAHQMCLTAFGAQMDDALKNLLPQLFERVVTDAPADYTALFEPVGFTIQISRSGAIATVQWRFRVASKDGQTVVDMRRSTTTPMAIDLDWDWSGFSVDQASSNRAFSAIEAEAISDIADAVDQFTRGAVKPGN
jgi:hypothetical protein